MNGFRVFVLTVLLIAAVVHSGCQCGDRFESKVRADSSLSFAIWRSRLANDFSVQERAEFDAALKELRMGIMLTHEAEGSVKIENALRGKIDGQTIRAVIGSGYEARWQRLQNECRALEGLLRQMSRVRTNPGDDASAKYLAGRREKHRTKLEADRREIELVESQLKHWLGDAYIPTVDDPEEKPQLISRERV